MQAERGTRLRSQRRLHVRRIAREGPGISRGEGMTATLIDLRNAREAAPDNVPELQAYLAQLVGEPFRFARVSYGDELTLHFGDLGPARSPRLTKRPCGAYVLGVRASPWLLKAGTVPLVLSAGIDFGAVSS